VRVTYVVLRIGVPSAEFITYYSMEKWIDISYAFVINMIFSLLQVAYNTLLRSS